MRDLNLPRLERRVALLLAPLADKPGAAVGVARDGALLLHRAAGLASVELRQPIGPATTFRIASVSKQFTCAAILLLAREGKLSLADPVRRHLPRLPEAFNPVTLDHLARNCSGVRDVLDLARLGGADLATPVTDAELDALLAHQRTLNFPPGTRFLYSNTGFRWLGQVVEQVAGEPLATFLDRRIFQPLGMASTRHTPDLLQPVEGLATGYLADGRRAPHAFPLGGEGGLVSTVEDLALWAHALSLGTLGGELESLLETTAPFSNGAPNRYALGLEVDTWRDLRSVSHGGLWPGYKTAFLRLPDKRITVIVASNSAALDPHHMALQVMEAALEGDTGLRPPPPPRDAVPMAGRWVAETEGLSLDVDADATARMHGVPFALVPGEDGRLHARRGAFPFAAALPRSDVLEVEMDAGIVLRFRRAEGAPLPTLDGHWHCAELDAEWLIEGNRVRANGPLRRGPEWHLEALTPRHLRVHMPSVLFPSWADAVLDGDTLTVNAGRARGLRFEKD